MQNVIPFPDIKKKKTTNNKLIKLVFCRKCLKQSCPDISNKNNGVVAMLIPIRDENKKPFHAYITIKVLDLKEIFSENNTSKFVDLAKYAHIHSISDGFEPETSYMEELFTKDNSETISILN